MNYTLQVLLVYKHHLVYFISTLIQVTFKFTLLFLCLCTCVAYVHSISTLESQRVSVMTYTQQLHLDHLFQFISLSSSVCCLFTLHLNTGIIGSKFDELHSASFLLRMFNLLSHPDPACVGYVDSISQPQNYRK